MSDNTQKPNLISPLQLAFIGDAVYTLLTRTHLLKAAHHPVNILTRAASANICAKSQSKNYYKLQEHLNQEELSILKRGRNASPNTKAKNQSITDYRNATGLEALFGYLYLKGDTPRINQLFEICNQGDQNE